MSEFLIIAGLSGAGRSQAANTFEDQGWFVIDNLPPTLITQVAKLASAPGSAAERVALVVGTGAYYDVDELNRAIKRLRRSGARVRILFLEASNEALVRRYENTRRRHPLAAERVFESIGQERTLLDPVKEQADVVVDTSEMNVHQLRDRLLELFASDDPKSMQTSVVSFGYKHGIPLDVDNVLDCRFLPNPHWIDELRPFTGRDPKVRDYVLGQPEAKQYLDLLGQMLDVLLPAYVKEGKSYLTIAVGCTGGRHRSVVLADEVGRMMRDRGFDPIVYHRDVDR